MTWQAWLEDRATARDEAWLTRRLRPRPAGDPTIDLAGNDYLGLSADPRVRAAAAQAATAYGAGAGASRLVTGTLDLHDALESELAAWLGQPAGLVFSTGYHARNGGGDTIETDGDLPIVDLRQVAVDERAAMVAADAAARRAALAERRPVPTALGALLMALRVVAGVGYIVLNLLGWDRFVMSELGGEVVTASERSAVSLVLGIAMGVFGAGLVLYFVLALLVFFGIGGVLFTWPLFTFLPNITNPVLAFGMLLIAFVILTGYTSINAVVKAEQFPQHIRALGVGIGYAVANSLFGGTAPVLYKAATEYDLVPLFIGYMTVLIAGSLVVYIFFLRNRGNNWLDHHTEMHRARAERLTPRG